MPKIIIMVLELRHERDAFGPIFFSLGSGCLASQNYTGSTRKHFLGVFRDEANDFIVLRAIAHEALGPHWRPMSKRD